MTEYAVKKDVRVVIIAGDLFDGNRVKSRTVDEILDAMRRTPNVDYLYLAGNHDDASYVFSDHDVPQNLKQFNRKWSTYTFENVDTCDQWCSELTEVSAKLTSQMLPEELQRLDELSVQFEKSVFGTNDKLFS